MLIAVFFLKSKCMQRIFDIIKISSVTGYYCYLKVPDKVGCLVLNFI